MFLFHFFFLLLTIVLTSSPLVPGTTPIARKCDVGWMLDYLSNHNSNFVNGHNLHWRNNGKFPSSVFFYFFKSFTCVFLLLATTCLPQQQQQQRPWWRARRPPIVNTNATNVSKQRDGSSRSGSRRDSSRAVSMFFLSKIWPLHKGHVTHVTSSSILLCVSSRFAVNELQNIYIYFWLLYEIKLQNKH